MKTKKSKTGKTKCIAIAIVILFHAVIGKAQWVDQSDQLPGITTPTYVWAVIGVSAALVITTSIILIAKHSKKKKSVTSMIVPEMNSQLKITPTFPVAKDNQFQMKKPCSFKKFELIKTIFTDQSDTKIHLLSYPMNSFIFTKRKIISGNGTMPFKL